MNNQKKEIDILEIFDVVKINDVIDFLETPIHYHEIYSKQIPIEHYSKTNLSLSELLVSYSQFCIEPENPFSLELRLFKEDQIIQDNDKIFIKRGSVCREYVEQNISTIRLSFFNFVKDDLNKNITHKQHIKKLLIKYNNKKFSLNKNEITKFFEKGLQFNPSTKDMQDIFSVDAFSPLNNTKNFSLKLCKCLLNILEHEHVSSFSEKYKSSLDNFNKLNLNYILLANQEPSIEYDTIEFLKHTASIFPILKFNKKNGINIPNRQYNSLDLLTEISLNDIQSFFTQYVSLESDLLTSVADIEQMFQSDDILDLLKIFLKKS